MPPPFFFPNWWVYMETYTVSCLLALASTASYQLSSFFSDPPIVDAITGSFILAEETQVVTSPDDVALPVLFLVHAQP